MLASAVRLREAVGEQGRILRDPGQPQASGPQVLERVTGALRVGARESARFDRALADYRQVVDQCKLQAPEPGRADQRYGGEDDHIRPVVARRRVEVPAAGHQPQRGGQVG